MKTPFRARVGFWLRGVFVAARTELALTALEAKYLPVEPIVEVHAPAPEPAPVEDAPVEDAPAEEPAAPEPEPEPEPVKRPRRKAHADGDV